MRLAPESPGKMRHSGCYCRRLSTTRCPLQTGCKHKRKNLQEQALHSEERLLARTRLWLCLTETFVSVPSSEVQAQAIKCVKIETRTG